MIEAMLNKIMTANLNDLMKVTYLQIEKIYLNPKGLISINPIPKYTVVNISMRNIKRNSLDKRDYLQIDTIFDTILEENFYKNNTSKC